MIPKSVQPGEIINEGDLPVIDDRKRAAGAWSRDLISGMPVGWFVTKLFQRAAVPEGSELWSSVEWVHPSHQDECERLPNPFPPDNWEMIVTELQTVGDWLDLLAATPITARAVDASAAPGPSPYNPENYVSIFKDAASHSGVRRAEPAAEPAVQEASTASPEEPPADQ